MVRPRQVRETLLQNGFVRVERATKNQKGKHGYFYRHPDGRATTLKENQGDIPKGTLKAMERQTGLSFT
jgi:predicted RNA binding protein YcfA (HicA-like mRNA interferase family)